MHVRRDLNSEDLVEDVSRRRGGRDGERRSGCEGLAGIRVSDCERYHRVREGELRPVWRRQLLDSLSSRLRTAVRGAVAAQIAVRHGTIGSHVAHASRTSLIHGAACGTGRECAGGATGNQRLNNDQHDRESPHEFEQQLH